MSWKEKLKDNIEPSLAQEIDQFETQIGLRRTNKIDEKIFAETRLRRGAYGQRYDNGRRYDGEKTQNIPFPSSAIKEGALTKGPDTQWDAPGMQRIKIPFGGLTTQQMEAIADIAEEYSDGICHITTRQTIQLHFVSLEDTPDLQRRLAASGITTREACGNSVRNITACPLSGICRGEAFDVTPYARASTDFLLGHADTQDFGRKIKIAFSGCETTACGLVMLHDIGCIAKTRQIDGKEQRGFAFYVGGGLGAIPYQAKLFDEFLSEQELFPTMQAISRVFARLGEKKNRGRARLKFLVAKLGIEEFKKLVIEEQATMKTDPAWTSWIADIRQQQEQPRDHSNSLSSAIKLDNFELWKQNNVYQQRQQDFVAVTITLPLGDITSHQLRQLAGVCGNYVDDTIRTTVEQNILLRWVPVDALSALYLELNEINLVDAHAQSIVDVTACPGTDTCKLGIASSRGLAAALRKCLAAKSLHYDAAVKKLRIKISGCFNSCGQHHVADIGFYGISRTVGNYKVPHFQLILGGRWDNNGTSYGKAVGAMPSKNIPEIIDLLLERYVAERESAEEHFQSYVARVGKKDIKMMLKKLMTVPAYDVDASFYRDWSDDREFSIGDIGVGECAGEVVSLSDFGIAAAEGDVFDAQNLLDQGETIEILQSVSEKALSAMLKAAQGLIKMQFIDISDDAAEIVSEFRQRFYDTELFFDPFAGGKFAQYLFHAYERRQERPNIDRVTRRIDEAQLFIEATHACYSRMIEARQLTSSVPGLKPGLKLALPTLN